MKPSFDSTVRFTYDCDGNRRALQERTGPAGMARTMVTYEVGFREQKDCNFLCWLMELLAAILSFFTFGLL